ncbi:hypothetical protein NZD89_07680 [Alicyclobacillus fastidiosus]|uniref:Uncharacterized protein n=1 Tax=Alicyclobacillus fastidiosus TaxID=392011 RepID=A0ABY6ZMS1_9BACL|nr:hypothetical protein [Alicyclobacillus fastidiosus]WAH43265.1 hypothetical protein NZD89_07680 [Alicyclobacillus fastidiosus]
MVLSAVYVLSTRIGKRSHIELLGDKRARACLNAPVVPIPNDHPLTHLQHYPGITILKSVSSLGVETFVTVVAPTKVARVTFIKGTKCITSSRVT